MGYRPSYLAALLVSCTLFQLFFVTDAVGGVQFYDIQTTKSKVQSLFSSLLPNFGGKAASVTEPRRAPKVNLKVGTLSAASHGKKDRSYNGVAALEPLLTSEPKSKSDMKERAARAKFLSTEVDLNKYNRRCYVDLGARTYSSSIKWFRNNYPLFRESNFEVWAFEADPTFNKEYLEYPEVHYFNKAVWVRNETLTFSGLMGHIDPGAKPKQKDPNAKDPKSKTRAFKADGIDIADFILRTFTVDDFVVVKMDIEGAEYDVVPRILSSGAVELIDELFMEGHTVKMNKLGGLVKGHVYPEVVKLLKALRGAGVHAHEWF